MAGYTGSGSPRRMAAEKEMERVSSTMVWYLGIFEGPFKVGAREVRVTIDHGIHENAVSLRHALRILGSFESALSPRVRPRHRIRGFKLVAD